MIKFKERMLKGNVKPFSQEAVKMAVFGENVKSRSITQKMYLSKTKTMPHLDRMTAYSKDIDKDGVGNAMDCYPFDKSRHGFFQKAKNLVTGKGFVDDEPTPEQVTSFNNMVDDTRAEINIEDERRLYEEANTLPQKDQYGEEYKSSRKKSKNEPEINFILKETPEETQKKIDEANESYENYQRKEKKKELKEKERKYMEEKKTSDYLDKKVEDIKTKGKEIKNKLSEISSTVKGKVKEKRQEFKGYEQEGFYGKEPEQKLSEEEIKQNKQSIADAEFKLRQAVNKERETRDQAKAMEDEMKIQGEDKVFSKKILNKKLENIRAKSKVSTLQDMLAEEHKKYDTSGSKNKTEDKNRGFFGNISHNVFIGTSEKYGKMKRGLSRTAGYMNIEPSRRQALKDEDLSEAIKVTEQKAEKQAYGQSKDFYGVYTSQLKDLKAKKSELGNKGYLSALSNLKKTGGEYKEITEKQEKLAKIQAETTIKSNYAERAKAKALIEKAKYDIAYNERNRRILPLQERYEQVTRQVNIKRQMYNLQGTGKPGFMPMKMEKNYDFGDKLGFKGGFSNKESISGYDNARKLGDPNKPRFRYVPDTFSFTRKSDYLEKPLRSGALPGTTVNTTQKQFKMGSYPSTRPMTGYRRELVGYGGYSKVGRRKGRGKDKKTFTKYATTYFFKGKR
jgi:hypothetical protein